MEEKWRTVAKVAWNNLFSSRQPSAKVSSNAVSKVQIKLSVSKRLQRTICIFLLFGCMNVMLKTLFMKHEQNKFELQKITSVSNESLTCINSFLCHGWHKFGIASYFLSTFDRFWNQLIHRKYFTYQTYKDKYISSYFKLWEERSCGATVRLQDKPDCLASWAEIRSPVRTISIARDFPTALVSLWVPPAPGAKEIRSATFFL